MHARVNLRIINNSCAEISEDYLQRCHRNYQHNLKKVMIRKVRHQSEKKGLCKEDARLDT